MKKSIRWRFAVPLMVFLAVAIAAISIYFSKTFINFYESNQKEILASEAREFNNEISQLSGYPFSIVDLQDRVVKTGQILNVRVTVVATDGTVIADSEADPAKMENHLNRPEIQQAIRGLDGFQIRYSATLKVNMLYVAVPVIADGKVFVIRFARPMDSITTSMRKLNQNIGIAGVLFALISLLITLFISVITFRPIKQLTEAAERLQTGDFEEIKADRSTYEIQQLTKAFNLMAVGIKNQVKALEDEKSKLASILEQMVDGVVIVDENGIIRLVNPAAEQMFLVSSSSVVGESLIKGFQHYQVVGLWNTTLKTKEQSTQFIEDRENQKFLKGIGTIVRGSMPRLVLLLFQDTTQQRQVELLRQDFVSNVSHELRTPIASMKALYETLRDGAVHDPPAAKRFLDLMEVEIEELNQMVAELLDLSKIESGQVPMKKRLTKVKDLITIPVERMRLQAERAGISLEKKVSKGIPEVFVDPERIEQVIVNLIHNAVKFTPSEGSITVTAEQKENDVVVRIKDTGVGISPDDLPRIFERFYKTDRARTSGGTGLGLSIAKHVIDAHGGTIWAESQPGSGSTFTFALPIKSSEVLTKR